MANLDCLSPSLSIKGLSLPFLLEELANSSVECHCISYFNRFLHNTLIQTAVCITWFATASPLKSLLRCFWMAPQHLFPISALLIPNADLELKQLNLGCLCVTKIAYVIRKDTLRSSYWQKALKYFKILTLYL